MDSILTFVKVSLGIDKSCKDFDSILIGHINTVLAILHQLGVGPEEGYMIEDSGDEWLDFIPDDPKYNCVKTYVMQKVRYNFDPPSNGSAMTALENILSELEWRIVELSEVKSNA